MEKIGILKIKIHGMVNVIKTQQENNHLLI